MTHPSSTAEWDDFFGEFYLRAYVHDEMDAQAAGDALAVARLAGVEPGADVIDVPCGYGRHTIALARAGYRVVGVDRSQTLLDEARRRAGHERWPKLIRADYRELPMPDASFDAAFNLYTSLGYLGDEEDTKVLAQIRRVLRPGGKLVLETMHRDRLVTGWQEKDWLLMGEGRLHLQQRTWDPVTGVAQTTQTLIHTNGERESRTFSVRTYSATELLAMIDAAGFASAKAYGSFTGDPLTTTSRLVIVAAKGDAP
ncbi:class I SAM-dependent methyltransferase [Solirubrobacter soli]|uniref:class I SAM-dependent methyltransferase n=1 Tax=Solirubrobacter soli TaxID=363832 RepID=UPI00146DF9F2|nr:class I SAM-dependent methyltransferase [Solirubrobacter soli]